MGSRSSHSSGTELIPFPSISTIMNLHAATSHSLRNAESLALTFRRAANWVMSSGSRNFSEDGKIHDIALLSRSELPFDLLRFLIQKYEIPICWSLTLAVQLFLPGLWRFLLGPAPGDPPWWQAGLDLGLSVSDPHGSRTGIQLSIISWHINLSLNLFLTIP